MIALKFIFFVFIVILVIIVIKLLRGLFEWNSNNNAIVLTVEATVVAKRTSKISKHSHIHDNMHLPIVKDILDESWRDPTKYEKISDMEFLGDPTKREKASYYYATFQVASGDRIELKISGKEYGILAEGDIGDLTFQGTRYKGFERVKIVNL